MRSTKSVAIAATQQTATSVRAGRSVGRRTRAKHTADEDAQSEHHTRQRPAEPERRREQLAHRSVVAMRVAREGVVLVRGETGQDRRAGACKDDQRQENPDQDESCQDGAGAADAVGESAQ